MKSALVLFGCLMAAACTSTSPQEHRDQVRALPGQQPLRVGLVVCSADRKLLEATSARPAAPGGAAPLAETAPPAAVGAVYCAQALLPESLPEDDLLAAVAELGAFTDVVPLPFDSRGVTTHEALIQRVQDRLWSLAQAQELDALLVVEGVHDGGLTFSDADESLFSLDSMLWWLCWPCGVWIADRDYTADVALRAELLWLGDQRATPEPLDASATAGSTALTPWSRANAPVLGFFVPPAWLDDDRAAVTTAVRDWTRAMLPIELVRRLKTSPFVETNPAQVTARVRGEVVEIGVESAQEVTDVAIVSLPRGALASAAVAVVVPCTARIETGPQGPRHVTVGRVPVTAVEQPVQPLLRVRVTLASGDVVSRTWTWADLSR